MHTLCLLLFPSHCRLQLSAGCLPAFSSFLPLCMRLEELALDVQDLSQ